MGRERGDTSGRRRWSDLGVVRESAGDGEARSRREREREKEIKREEDAEKKRERECAKQRWWYGGRDVPA